VPKGNRHRERRSRESSFLHPHHTWSNMDHESFEWHGDIQTANWLNRVRMPRCIPIQIFSKYKSGYHLQVACANILAYTTVCQHMPASASICQHMHMLTYAGIYKGMLAYACLCWICSHMLGYAGMCSDMLLYRTGDSCASLFCAPASREFS